MEERIRSAHSASIANQTIIQNSEACGCFFCLRSFPAVEVETWISDEQGETAICPYCGVDAVLGDRAGYPVDHAFLSEMKKYWFEL